MYYALIGDIIRSQLDRERSITQKKYIEVLEEINNSCDCHIAARFKIRDGDGFHGLLLDSEKVMEIIMKIRLALAPTQIRIGIGVGNIRTEINKYKIQEIDGNAFNIARAAMDDAHAQEKKYESVFQHTILRFDNSFRDSENDALYTDAIEDLINLTFCTCSLIERGWSEKQAEVIKLKMNGLSQREIAHQLHITQASVYARIKSSEFYTYRFCTEHIQLYLNSLRRE